MESSQGSDVLEQVWACGDGGRLRGDDRGRVRGAYCEENKAPTGFLFQVHPVQEMK